MHKNGNKELFYVIHSFTVHCVKNMVYLIINWWSWIVQFTLCYALWFGRQPFDPWSNNHVWNKEGMWTEESLLLSSNGERNPTNNLSLHIKKGHKDIVLFLDYLLLIITIRYNFQ